ncbi:hypothetical protein ALC60_11892, partial [Trachymyrmex zeteki]
HADDVIRRTIGRAGVHVTSLASIWRVTERKRRARQGGVDRTTKVREKRSERERKAQREISRDEEGARIHDARGEKEIAANMQRGMWRGRVEGIAMRANGEGGLVVTTSVDPVVGRIMPRMQAVGRLCDGDGPSARNTPARVLRHADTCVPVFFVEIRGLRTRKWQMAVSCRAKLASWNILLIPDGEY